MKRCLLIFAFFVGLIPNMKEMTLGSVYCVMGQGMYDENFWDEVPEGSCEDLGGIWCEICSTCHAETNTNSSCQTKCEQCGIYYPTGSGHYHNDTDDDSENSSDNNDNGGEDSNIGFEINNKYRYLCLNCYNSSVSVLYTYEGWKMHSKNTRHQLFEIVIP